jgi:predicted extracellular nuclease
LKSQILRGEKQRQTQIRSVLKKLDHQKPGFIAGDFNDFLDSKCLYNVKTLGLLMAELASYQLDIHSHLNSTYVYSKEYASHNYWTFDHVLSNKLSINLKTPIMTELIPFPNKSEPSDHLMMVFDFSN